MKTKQTQFQKLLSYLLMGGSISNRDWTDNFRITGSSFHRLLKEIREKYHIKYEKYQKGEGKAFYYEYRLRWQDIKMIKKLNK